MTKCARCPVKVRECGSAWAGCGDACALLRVGKFKHALIGCSARGDVEGLRAAVAEARRQAPPCDVTVQSHLAGGLGYGKHSAYLGRALESLGARVGYDPIGVSEDLGPLPSWVRARIGRAGPRRLLIAPPHCERPAADAWLTMWESTRLPGDCVERLNRARRLLVPCRANVHWFRESGVTAPIDLAPLGPMVPVRPTPVALDGPTVFGAAGRMAHGGCRKGLSEVMAAFVAAFPRGDSDVRLEVKCWPDCVPLLDVPDDPRITLITESWDDARLARWYSGLTAYVTASKGEGWGLHTHEAMAAGRPAIATSWGGTAEFFDAESGWALDYDLSPASGIYSGCGDWAVPRQDAMVAALRAAHGDRAECARRGAVAAERTAQWTHERGARAVLDALGWTAPTSVPTSTVTVAAAAPAPAHGTELEVLAIVGRCRFARVCGCAHKGYVSCQPGGKRAGENLHPDECEACLAG